MILKVKKELFLLLGTIFLLLLVEVLVFNRSFILDQFFSPQEQRLTIHDGNLHQIKLKNSKLVSQGTQANIIFNNINLPVDRISVTCENSKAPKRGQVFYRAAGKDFTWLNSVSYETGPNTQIIDLPATQMVTALRFDLSHSLNDVIQCGEFVINPPIPFNIRLRRVAVYMAFVLLAVFEVVRKLLFRNEIPLEAFPSWPFQRLAVPLLVVCLVFPDIVFLGASLRATDQVHGNRFLFPPITFYPTYAHQNWNAGMADYGGAYYQSEPMMEFMVRSLRESESPYWNPYSAAGSLGPETLVDNKFSAFTLAYAMLGGGQKTYNTTLLFLYFMAAYFTHLFLREKLQLSFLASLTGIFFFLLNGFSIANVGSNVTQSYLFVPMCLYASCSLVEKPTALRILGVVLSFAAFFSYTFMPTTLTGFAGMYAVILGYVVMFYRRTQRDSRWLLGVLSLHAACVFASFLLLAFIYFPIAENLHNTGTVNVYSERRFRPLSWVLIPSVFSNSHFFESYHVMERVAKEYAKQGGKSLVVYQLGTTALILAICSLSFKRREFAPFVLFCLVAVLIGFGRVFGVPGISSLISHLPIVSFMIASPYWWPIIVIPLIPLTALGMDHLQNRSILPVLPVLPSVVLVSLLIAVGAVIGLHEPNLWYKQWSIFLLVSTAIMVSLAMALSVYSSDTRLRNFLVSALVLLVFAEMTMDSKTLRYAPEDLFTNAPTEIDFIKKNIGLSRTLTIGYDFGVRHEIGSVFGIQEVTAINQGTLPAYMDYFHGMISLDESQRVSYDYYPSLRSMKDTPGINTINWEAVNLLGVKYIIAPTNFTQYREVFIEHGLIPVLNAGTVYVYENPAVLPRAFTVKMDWSPEKEAISLSLDELSQVEPAAISLYRNNEVVLKGTVNRRSLLVLTDNWQANWKAFVNGAPGKIIVVNGTFRGVQVPRGTFEVRFHYQPGTLNLAILTAGIIILFLLYILIDQKRIDRYLITRFSYV